MALSVTNRVSGSAALMLIGLESMPCGCISGVYRARTNGVEVGLVEAKGPHCLFYGHRAGDVVWLGGSDEYAETGRESRV